MEAESVDLGQYDFAVGFTACVMQKYCPSWKNNFYPDDYCHVFTPQLQDSIVKILDKRGIELFFVFSEDFASDGVTVESFLEITDQLLIDFADGPFDAKEFIWFAVTVAYYGVLAYLQGVAFAPYATTMLIYSILRQHVECGNFTAASYKDVERAALEIINKG